MHWTQLATLSAPEPRLRLKHANDDTYYTTQSSKNPFEEFDWQMSKANQALALLEVKSASILWEYRGFYRSLVFDETILAPLLNQAA